ncbi:RNA polymerase sigma factor [Peribacillus simplex]|uniref:RNA polymerase sigma factor n=1 Tax=Peribacillus simplex TaxID=1478 RepID=UPI0028535C10|nr:RNA polymerase sigma factor [Peribacillus simplex]MDR4928727.1 RNA polymerase sigma factor [Peribacillus simplex]
MKSRFSNDQLIKVMNELYYYVKKQGADSETAKDIVQESVYKLMIHIESIDTDKHKAWLFRVAINLYYDYCRKNKKSQFQLLDENLVSNSKLIEDLMITKENQNQIKNTLERLPLIFKQLLLLKYDLEWSYQQIAEYLEMKPSGVKTYLARARAKFKELYWREENEGSK